MQHTITERRNILYDKFRQIITERGLTVYKIAKDTDIPQSTFSQWKSGRSVPKVDKLQKVAKYLDVPLEDLVEGVK